MSNTIDIESTTTPAEPPTAQNMALERRPEVGALGRAMTLDELHANLEFIRKVMRQEMKEGQDFGKIPGTGDRKTLLQPGAQKLLMTFNLSEYVKKEVLREYPGLHREYEFTVAVKAPNGKEWDGVGTCSTLESKYRYRKAERTCPTCHKTTIIKGKEEYGGGWVCFKKKGGCGAKFVDDAPAIVSQPAEDVENEDPADCWNTVRKMAFKRALVAAAINATNTSELWTQDLEEIVENEAARPKHKASQAAPGRATASPPPVTPPKAEKPPITQAVKPAEAKKTPPPPATPESRQRMIKKLEDHGLVDLATEYFRILDKPTILLPTEELGHLPLEWVPITTAQMWLLESHIKDFGNGAQAEHPYKPNPRPEAGKPAPPPAAKTGEAKPKPHVETAKAKDPEWWRDVICPVPPRGMKRDEYMKHPQTVGDLYEGRHDPEVNRRLYGFVMNFTVSKTWVTGGGETRMRPQTQVDADTLFREALDACKEYGDKHAGDTQNPDAKESHAGTGAAGAQPLSEEEAEAEQRRLEEDDSVPF